MKKTLTAFEKATGYLGIRKRTVSEVRKYLITKGYSLSDIIEAVDKLTEYGYLNDKEWANDYVEAYRSRGGVNKLKAAMYKAGVDREAIDEAVADLGTQIEDAAELARRWLRGKDTGGNRYELKVRLSRHLAGKGFRWETVKNVCDRILTDAEEFE